MDQFENNNQNLDENIDIANETVSPVEDEKTANVEQSSPQQPTASFTIPQQQYYSYSPRSQNQPNNNYAYQNQAQYYSNTVTQQPVKVKKSGKNFSFTTLIASVLICAIVSTVISSAVTMLAYDGSNNSANNSTTNNAGGNKNTTITNTTENFVEAVAEKVQPSVVGITVTYNSYSFFGNQSSTDSSGSGVIYTSDGYIITNKHVIDYAISRNAKIGVYLSSDMEKAYDATVIGYDSSTDLAVIKIDANNLPAAEIGKSSDLKIGQNVVAVGTPGGLQFMGSVSVGYISGLNRELTIDSMQMSLIQTDTAINPGNSGGALVDNEGKLIGITNAKLVSEDFEGMGFAIPIDKVTEICDGIITGKGSAQPYIGVNINTSYTAEILESQGLPAGAVVGSVIINSPAANAGIKAFDIIVSVDDKSVKDYNQLVSAIKAHNVGDEMQVKVYREGKYIDLKVIVGTNS